MRFVGDRGHVLSVQNCRLFDSRRSARISSISPLGRSTRRATALEESPCPPGRIFRRAASLVRWMATAGFPRLLKIRCEPRFITGHLPRLQQRRFGVGSWATREFAARSAAISRQPRESPFQVWRRGSRLVVMFRIICSYWTSRFCMSRSITPLIPPPRGSAMAFRADLSSSAASAALRCK